jgi:plastocyanin
VQALAGPWRRPVVPAAAALPAPGAAGTATGSSGVPTPVGEPTPTTVPDGGGAPPPPAAPPRLLGVTAREFSLVASRTVVGTGEVTVQLVNRGEDPHDLRLEPLDGQGGGGDLALTESGTTTTAKLRLEPGAYRMLCTLPQHAGLGMRGQITSAQ